MNAEAPRGIDRFPFLKKLKEKELPERRFNAMKNLMVHWGNKLREIDPSKDKTLSGEGDTGSIVKQTDLMISDALLAHAREEYPGSFSEEHDPQDPGVIFPSHKRFARLKIKNLITGLWMIDPVDGTGDRDKGEPDSPEQKGYSILSTFVHYGRAEASIVVRPAHDQVIAYRNDSIYVTDDGESRIHTSIDRQRKNKEVSANDDPLANVVRVNVREAYPEVNFPPEFWKFAKEATGFTFQEVRSGGAGDSLSKLVLGELDLVIARKGDWKSWDTGPFDPMIAHLGGKMTDCDNFPLGSYVREDLWHHRGVAASIGEKGLRAHDALLMAMRLYKLTRGQDMIIQTPPKSSN